MDVDTVLCPRCEQGTVEADRVDRVQRYHADMTLCPCVSCDDETCRALEHPDRTNLEQVLAALDHWRGHQYLCGCSHGC